MSRSPEIQQLRLLHFLLMFAFGKRFLSVIHHVYSAVLFDTEERNRELSSIVTGWKTDLTDGEER